MDEKEFLRDLWDLMRGNTEYITPLQFTAKYDKFLVDCDAPNIRFADDNNEWCLTLHKTYSNA